MALSESVTMPAVPATVRCRQCHDHAITDGNINTAKPITKGGTEDKNLLALN